MPLSTEVIVRKDNISFPQRCVVCGGAVDREQARLRGSPVGFYGVIPWILGATKKLEVPAHPHCGSKLGRALMIRNLGLVAGVTAVLAFAIGLELPKWHAIGLAVGSMAIPVAWQVMRPLPFEFTHRAGRFKLMFLDPSLAREVATLNDGEMDDDDHECDHHIPPNA